MKVRNLIFGVSLTAMSVLASALLVSKPAVAACATPTPTTSSGYQQMLRGTINGKWYTADSGHSVKLPNGKILWVFGDTLIGDSGQTRANHAIHNSAILTEKGCATALTGPLASGKATDWVKPTGTNNLANVDDYYWAAGAPYVEGTKLYMFLWHMYNDANGFHTIGTDLATFDVSGSTPKLVSVIKTPSSASYDATPAWGASTYRNGSYTYIYGNLNKHETWVFGHYYYLARVPNGKIATQSSWRYWNGSSWVTSKASAQPIVNGDQGVGAGASVYRRSDGTFIMTSKKYDMIGTDVVAWTAPTVTGPWTETKTLLAPVPDVNTEAGEHTYFGLAHPEITLPSGKLLLSWSLNSSDPGFFGDPRYGVYLTEVDKP